MRERNERGYTYLVPLQIALGAECVRALVAHETRIGGVAFLDDARVAVRRPNEKE
jgi:hypothetical protein